MDLKQAFIFGTIIAFGVAIGMVVGNSLQDRIDAKARP